MVAASECFVITTSPQDSYMHRQHNNELERMALFIYLYRILQKIQGQHYLLLSPMIKRSPNKFIRFIVCLKVKDYGLTNIHMWLGIISKEKPDLPVSGDRTEVANAKMGSNGDGAVVSSGTGSADADIYIGNEEKKLEPAATENKAQGMESEKINGEEKLEGEVQQDSQMIGLAVKYIFTHIAAMEHKEGAVALNYPDFRYMETAEHNPGAENTEEVNVYFLALFSFLLTAITVDFISKLISGVDLFEIEDEICFGEQDNRGLIGFMDGIESSEFSGIALIPLFSKTLLRLICLFFIYFTKVVRVHVNMYTHYIYRVDLFSQFVYNNFRILSLPIFMKFFFWQGGHHKKKHRLAKWQIIICQPKEFWEDKWLNNTTLREQPRCVRDDVIIELIMDTLLIKLIPATMWFLNILSLMGPY
ncbi:hypothetical protein ACJX0J_026186 [Zea mays]